MCLADWRLGRMIRAEVTNYSTPGTITLGLDPQRVGFMVCVDVFSVSTGSILLDIEVDGLVFERMRYPNTTFMATLVTHGEVPGRNLSLVPGQGISNLYITQWYLPESFMNEAIEDFMKGYKKWSQSY